MKPNETLAFKARPLIHRPLKHGSEAADIQHSAPNTKCGSEYLDCTGGLFHPPNAELNNPTTQQPNNPTTQQLNNSTTVGLRHHCYHPCNLNTVCVTIASGRSLPIATRSVPEIAAGVSL